MYRKHNKIIIVVISSMLKLDISTAIDLFTPGLVVMVINNIISWWSVLLMEETGVPRENHWPTASHWQILSHNVVSSTSRERGSQRYVLIGSRQDITDILLKLALNTITPTHILNNLSGISWRDQIIIMIFYFCCFHVHVWTWLINEHVHEPNQNRRHHTVK
jgi:hypothetical protein